MFLILFFFSCHCFSSFLTVVIYSYPAGGGSSVRVLHLRVGALLLPEDAPQHASSGNQERDGKREP